MSLLRGLLAFQSLLKGTQAVMVPRRPEVFNSPRQILTLQNKVPGY